MRALGRLPHVRGLEALRPLHDLELDRLSLREAPEPLRDDRGVVDEHVRRTVPRDEAVSLRIVEPLHSAFFHRHNSLSIRPTVRAGTRSTSYGPRPGPKRPLGRCPRASLAYISSWKQCVKKARACARSVSGPGPGPSRRG